MLLHPSQAGAAAAPLLFTALDDPNVAAVLARFLYAEDAVRLHSSSWLLYHGVVGRKTCPLTVAVKHSGFGPGARLSAWLACMGQPTQLQVQQETQSQLPALSAPANGATVQQHNVGSLGEIDRDVARTFPAHPLFNIPDALLGVGGAPMADAWSHLPSESGARMLHSVLTRVCVARPSVAYCQVRGSHLTCFVIMGWSCCGIRTLAPSRADQLADTLLTQLFRPHPHHLPCLGHELRGGRSSGDGGAVCG